MLPAAQASNKAAKSKSKPTPEQIEALRAARAQKKEDENRKAELAEAAAREAARERAARGEIPVDPNTGKPLYVGRSWAVIAHPTDAPEAAQQRKVRILSWNILAQGLIQRKLFPGSDALKWKDRSAGLGAELVGHAYDVGCFQEVDRFEVHSTALRHHGYAYEYQRGYRVKKHGLAIVWRTIARPGSPGAVFAAEPAGRALLYLDHASVSDGDSTDETGRRRTACSRETRNIALFVAIRFADRKGGLIVATTHTFWHPKH
ncbi:RNA exonuclease ngl2, partial [Tilletia horrida]